MIIGERVRLRLLEHEDLAQIADWRNEPRTASQFFGCWPFTKSGQEAWYQSYLADPTQRMWMIATLHNVAVGTLALTNIDYHNQSAELGRVLIGDQNHLGAECAAEAVRLLVKFAFEEVNLHRIEVRVLAGNTNALTLYRNCGFGQDGTLRKAIWKHGKFEDVIVLAIIREEDGLGANE